MKREFYCPACGARELSKMFITTHKGTKLSLLMSSQANIRKSSGEVMCENCKNVWLIADASNSNMLYR